jgi:undecaprenyl diphosphate synthase
VEPKEQKMTDIEGLRQPKGKSGDIFLAEIKRGEIPKHVAIIMDGNGRWARQRRLPRLAGHRAGVEVIREVLRAAQEAGIKYMTLYAFSAENWRRPKSEVQGLMKLLKETIRKELDQLNAHGIKINIIGRWSEFPPDLVKELERATEITTQNQKGVLNLALNYGSRTEIVDAVKKIVVAVLEGRQDPATIDAETFEKYLYAPETPPPDLLIRTSGEMRVSNFLLWQIAYAEIWVTPILWPDFEREDLFRAIRDFQQRKRRYGGLDLNDLGD